MLLSALPSFSASPNRRLCRNVFEWLAEEIGRHSLRQISVCDLSRGIVEKYVIDNLAESRYRSAETRKEISRNLVFQSPCHSHRALTFVAYVVRGSQ